MKKIVFIFLMLLCLTGCDNSVEFNFDKDIKTKVKDEKEQPVYNKQMIYQWIDNIRMMGNMQSFYQGNQQTNE